MLMIVRIPGQAVSVPLVFFFIARFFSVHHQFSGPFLKGHEFGLMVDGDEFCLRLCEHGGQETWPVFWRTDGRNVPRTSVLLYQCSFFACHCFFLH